MRTFNEFRKEVFDRTPENTEFNSYLLEDVPVSDWERVIQLLNMGISYVMIKPSLDLVRELEETKKNK